MLPRFRLHSSAILAALIAGTASAQTVVIPPANATTPGNYPMRFMFETTARTAQWVIPGADLATVPGADTITGMRFRTTELGWIPDQPINHPHFDVYIGELAVPLNTPLNPRFHDNVVPGTEIQVRSGFLIVYEGSYPATQTPNDFGPLIEFNTPFQISANKNYAITVRHNGGLAFAFAAFFVDGNLNAGPYRGVSAQSYTTLTSTSQLNYHIAQFELTSSSPTCYANCDGSTVEPVLNVEDFTCFVSEFAQGLALAPAQQVAHYANCDGSSTDPVLNVEDFICFVGEFADGCP
jgi:hypothetical protein